jgi:hypothetical protein
VQPHEIRQLSAFVPARRPLQQRGAADGGDRFCRQQIGAQVGAEATAAEADGDVAAAFAGLWVGTALRQRLPLPVFQRALYSVFLALGALMLARSF